MQMKAIFRTLKLSLLSAATLFACQSPAQEQKKAMNQPLPKTSVQVPAGLEVATFGSGCFWCTEAVFQRLEGVVKVESGYSGGFVANPTYKQVCTGQTGHAEVTNITYDPKKISFADLLAVFWRTHDPTTLNRQGNDVGPQYRSAVFYHNAQQKEEAEHWKQEVDKAHIYPDPLVTEITAFTNFYKAEDYHQNYFNENGSQPYCQFVVRPKVEKFEKVFKDKLKAH
ncbi:peptide-methionine (S)-S-oxide reductase [Siphonobacter aquaeclarae]|jgi:peptide-methionine (S)-S-oxide reductase|uniref:Peptide methionine sulfoxide reductase MsrA n=2 Tax=Siphonobacter aquaeclarae TaxID=563176 RepID=A0A1G9VD51_9BACT|nr:peptide-methionine (S)-S-oxide reductase [Siphonobacter aquaeclarae]